MKKLVALSFLFLTPIGVLAQDTTKVVEYKPLWLNMGLGSAGGDFLSGGLSFSGETGTGLVSVRFVHNEEFLIFDGKPQAVWDLGVLYGVYLRGDGYLASISGGIGLVGGRRGKFLSSSGGFFGEEVRFRTFGMPLEAQLFLRPFTGFGIGIYSFANINSEKSFRGILLSLQFGGF